MTSSRWPIPFLIGMPCAMPAAAEVSAAQVQELEARIAQLEASAAAAPSAGTAASRLKVDGFMTAGFGYANADRYEYDSGLRETVSHKADSVIGLQVEGRVNNKTSAVTQLVARGADDFLIDTQWAYISHRASDSSEFRIGRMLAPHYLMSEYREVGYAYPWVQPPAELYISAGSNSFDGVAYLYSLDVGQWRHDMYVNWGGADASEGFVEASDAVNLGLVSSIGSWQFAAKLSSSDVRVTNPLFDALATQGLIPRIDDRLTYTVVGIQYDNGKLLFMGEGSRIEMEGAMPDTDAAYATVGYRFGKFMPHLTWASSRIRDSGDRPDQLAFSTQDDLFGNPSGAPDLCPLNDPNPDASLCLARVPYDPTRVPPALAALIPAGTQTLGVAYPADFLARILERAQDSVTLGMRYDVMNNMAVKFDWTRVIDTHGTFGLLTPADGNFFVDPATGQAQAFPGDEFDVLRVAVDVVF